MAVKFIFLVLPDLHLMDLAGPNQVILASISFGAEFEIEYCSIDKPLSTSSGLPIGELKNFSEVRVNSGDFVIVAGTSSAYLTSEEFLKEKKLLRWLKDVHSIGVNICSICTGAFALGAAGLLDDIKCTTHFSLTEHLHELYPTANVVENILFTESDGIFTSAGIASGIDLTLHIVEKLKGSYFAHLIARELVVYNRRTGNQKQHSEMLEFRNHLHSGIHKVQDWLHANLHKKVNLIQLAEIANMSDRNFTRVFKRETGITVKNYVTVLRKEKIKTLSKNPDISKSQIARKCGLLSSRQIFRIMNREDKALIV
ncbi:MAG: DJ-1/PfpI family protein [Ignavibacteria bacterium]|nr:DJ-1/PfpI family protein [Ignavibacteria bacterium]